MPALGALPRWVLDRLGDLAGCRSLDRLLRGRAWIAVIAAGLLGIVAMQVHMLELNAGIGRAVETAGTLERENAALRMDVSRLSASARLEAEAQRLGLVMPPAGSVRYLELRRGYDARRAAKIAGPPRPVAPETATAATPSATTAAPATAAAPPETTVAPVVPASG